MQLHAQNRAFPKRGRKGLRMHRRTFLASSAAFGGLALSGFVRRAMGQGAAQVQALTAAYNESGQQLFKAFSAAPGNIVFSPYSIGTAMAMALAGARAETEPEMGAAPKQRLPPAAGPA